MMQWKIRHDFMVLNKIESGTGREKHEKLKVRTIQFLECMVTFHQREVDKIFKSLMLKQLFYHEKNDHV